VRFDPSARETWERVDYNILNMGGFCLYKRTDLLEDGIAGLVAISYRIFDFDCTDWSNDAIMHSQLAARLEFPEYYGRNLDALSECLGDFPFLQNEAAALVLRRFDDLFNREPELAATLLHIIASAEWEFLLTERRLVCLLQSNDPWLHSKLPQSLGRRGAHWNHAEFLDANRV
jgi:RNAse (barnase) inhibitor barstar